MKDKKDLELATSPGLGWKACLEKCFFSDLSPREF